MFSLEHLQLLVNYPSKLSETLSDHNPIFPENPYRTWRRMFKNLFFHANQQHVPETNTSYQSMVVACVHPKSNNLLDCFLEIVRQSLNLDIS